MASGMGGVVVRAANDDDLPQIYDLYYADATGHTADPGSRPSTILDIHHEYAAGTMLVVDEAGVILGFASVTTRGQVAFLSSLFVRPDAQSRRLGRALLNHVLPQDGTLLCTLSSSDPRAMALYTRFGMRPRWPNLLLQGGAPRQTPLRTPSAQVGEADPADEALVTWDAAVAGRPRPRDHRYWIDEERAVPLWFSRRGARIGYGYVRLGAGTFRHPEAATIGPVGAHSPRDSLACTLAAMGWAASHAPMLRIDVPGPHPALAPLLEAGFRILDVDTYCQGGMDLVADPSRYISSGGSLF